MSSANCRCMTRILSLPISAGLKNPPIRCFFNNKLNPSVSKRKKKGDKRSPCLNPYWRWNSPDGLPFTNTETDVIFTHSIIHLLHCGWNLNLSIMMSMYSQSTVSYIFAKSILKNILSNFLFFRLVHCFILKLILPILSRQSCKSLQLEKSA